MKNPIFMSAVATVISLMGGVLGGAGLVSLVNRLPFHTPDQTLLLLAIIPMFGGGALWGFLLTRIHGLPNRKGTSIAGSLSFGLGVIGAVNLLGALERIFVAQHRLPGLAIHNIFTLLFMPVTFLVAALGGSAILLVSGDRTHWLRSALATGLAAALSFLIMDFVLDTLGMRVGAPGAEKRFTMLMVAFLGSAAAALSGGAILGRVLSKDTNNSHSAISEISDLPVSERG